MEIVRKNFILKKDYLGKKYIIVFTDINGKVVKYDHDKLFEKVSIRLTQLPCWNNYGYYTNSRKMPRYMEIAMQDA